MAPSGFLYCSCPYAIFDRKIQSILWLILTLLIFYNAGKTPAFHRCVKAKCLSIWDDIECRNYFIYDIYIWKFENIFFSTFIMDALHERILSFLPTKSHSNLQATIQDLFPTDNIIFIDSSVFIILYTYIKYNFV